MKKILHLLLTLTVLAGLAFVLWTGVRKQQEMPEHDAEAPVAAAPPATEAAAPAEAEEYRVTLDKERAETLGLETAPLEKVQQQARRRAWGTVIDPTPLVTLDNDLAAAESALTISKSDNERTQKLAATNDASQKAAETAAAQFRADQLKLDALTRTACLQWGTLFDPDPAVRRPFIDSLLTGRTALVRADLLPGESLPSLPKSARLELSGTTTSLTSSEVHPATTADPRTQGQGFLLRLDDPASPLLPGMALTVWLDLPEPPARGFALPRSAVLRHDGQTWVYVREEEDEFVRKPVTLTAPLDTAPGWFIAESAGLSAGDTIITTGTGTVLSEELKATGGEDELE